MCKDNMIVEWYDVENRKKFEPRKIERRQATYKNRYTQTHRYDGKLKVIHYISQIKFFRNWNSQWKTDGFVGEIK